MHAWETKKLKINFLYNLFYYTEVGSVLMGSWTTFIIQKIEIPRPLTIIMLIFSEPFFSTFISPCHTYITRVLMHFFNFIIINLDLSLIGRKFKCFSMLFEICTVAKCVVFNTLPVRFSLVQTTLCKR